MSYRSADEPHAAVLIAQTLTGRAGPGTVFLDTSSIPAGAHFPKEIRAALDSCHTLIAVIGQRWLEPGDDGTRRIDDPADYVRREIATALSRDIAVVPVLVAGAAMPQTDDLPSDLVALTERQCVTLRAREQVADAERIATALVGPRDRVPEPPATSLVNTFYGPVHADTIGISYRHHATGGT